MATIKQRVAVDNLVENRGNISQAMLKAGYDPTTAKNPKNLTESVGFKEILKEYGLTEGLVTKALVEDIKAKPQNRLGELRLAAEVLNMTDAQGIGNKTLIVVLPKEIAEKHSLNVANTAD